MEREELLKRFILEKYKSIREFCQIFGFPYSTIDNIFKREKGIMGVSVSLMLRVCECLEIDIEELINGKIVPANNKQQQKKTVENDSLSENKRAIIEFAHNVPEEKAALVLRVMKLISEDSG